MRRVVVLALVALGCGHAAQRHRFRTDAPSDYPCVLRDPSEWSGDFMVRQSMTIRARRGTETIEGQLDAVVQKQGDTLLVVGIGPMNAKAFTLTQRAGHIEFAQFFGPALPFSPRNIIVDVHRLFFKRLPAPTAPGYSGPVRGQLDGEWVEESWQGGELRARVFTRPDGPLRGAVRIDFGPGCRASRCEPETATLRNEWFGYTLAIVNDAFEALP